VAICLLYDFLVPGDVHLGLVIFLGRVGVRVFFLQFGDVHTTLLVCHDHFRALSFVSNLTSIVKEQSFLNLMLYLGQNLPTVDFEIVSRAFFNPVLREHLTLVSLQRNRIINWSDRSTQVMSLLLHGHLVEFLSVPHRV